MAVMTLDNEEFYSLPDILREYASYMSVMKGSSPKTVCEYLLDLRSFLRYMKSKGTPYVRDDFEKISVSDTSFEAVRSVKEHDVIGFLMFAKLQMKNGPAAQNRKRSALRSFYRYMTVKKHYMEIDPTVSVDSPKQAKNLPKYLSYDECLSLLRAVRADIESPTQARDFAIIVLFLNTGMRLSELVNLNLSSFSSDLKNVRVVGKGNKERMLHMNDSSINAVRDYLEVRLDPKYVRTSDNALFLSMREQRISAKTVQWMVNKYIILAGLGNKGISVHKLRHTAATLMYQYGNVDIRVLKDVLGHEQLNTTQIYTHVEAKNVVDAIESNPLANTKMKRITIPKNDGK